MSTHRQVGSGGAVGKGRHQAANGTGSPGRYVIAGIVVGALVVAGYLFVDMARGGGGCSSNTAVSLTAAPDLAPTVAELVDETPAKDLGCSTITVTAQESSAAAQGLVGGADVPDLWIPDSMTWVRKVNKTATVPVELAAGAVAVSPAVILTGAAADLAPASWLEVLRNPQIRLGNPVASATAAAPVLAAVAETQTADLDPQDVAAALVPAAQAQSRQLSADALAAAPGAAGDRAPTVADAVRANGGMGVVTEQAALALGTEFTAVVPASGTVFMEYPLVVSARTDQRAAASAAAQRVLALLTSDRGQSALSGAGFRSSAEVPLADGRGVGAVAELTTGDAAAAEQALARWSALAVPTRGLVVIDVSGSMAAESGDGATRIALTQQAALVGAELFPGNAQLGLWAFSLNLGGSQQDYVELAPIDMLDAPAAEGTHRQRLAGAVGGLDEMVGGGTGLYDTAFAAYKSVLDGYDPSAVNAVIILTDGENEDPSSITREQLMAGLASLADPARPVVLVAIGITDDADAEVLAEMAQVTGGTSYVARDPADIPTVFVKALSQRQG